MKLIATFQLALISPAALFMAALVVRKFTLLPLAAHTAQQLVMWYAGRVWTLWVLLLALPFTVLVTGCATLPHPWRRDSGLLQIAKETLAAVRANWATLFVAATTLTSMGILAVVVLHMLAN
jgi:hypothetical protein